MRYYAGIGSRETPADMQEVMKNIAIVLEQADYILRSGGAKGADAAFESGVSLPRKKEIYLPWQGFNDSTSELYLNNIRESKHAGAYMIAQKFYHSNLDRAPDNTVHYMTRNSFQVLGESLMEPSEFIICWTKDGKASGGTGQAIRIANSYNIPVFNLKNMIDREQLFRKLWDIKHGIG